MLWFEQYKEDNNKASPQKGSEVVRGLKQTTLQAEEESWHKPEWPQEGFKGGFSASLLKLSLLQCYLLSSGIAVGLERPTERAALRNAVSSSHHGALWRPLMQQRLPVPFNPDMLSPRVLKNTLTAGCFPVKGFSTIRSIYESMCPGVIAKGENLDLYF